MFELMLSSGTKRMGKIYPDSGPGEKMLGWGNPTMGFFGEIPESLLLTSYDLRQQLDFWIGEDQPDLNTRKWLKFFIDEKVIFIPKQAYSDKVTWDDLYKAGLVRGVDNGGPDPVATPTNQLRYVAAPDSSVLKVRLLTTNTVPVPDPANAIWNSPATAGSEWGRIVTTIMTDLNGLGPAVPMYKIYKATDPVLSRIGYVIGQNSYNGATRQVAANNTSLSLASVTTPMKWLPALELMPKDTAVVFPMSRFNVATNTLNAPLISEPLQYFDPVYKYTKVGAAVLTARELVSTPFIFTNPVLTIERTSIKLEINPATQLNMSISYV